jgi:hypothetical protein
MTTLKLEITKKELEKRIHAALEQAMQSPITKKRNKIVNAAMVQILHGGNASGQNEHNLDMFFEEKNSEDNDVYIGFLNIINKKTNTTEEIIFKKGTKNSVLLDIYHYIFDVCSTQHIEYRDVYEYFKSRNCDYFEKNIIVKYKLDLLTNLEFINEIKKEHSTIQRIFINYLRNQKYYYGMFYNQVVNECDEIESIKKENKEILNQDNKILKNNSRLINNSMSRFSDLIFYDELYSDSIGSIEDFFIHNNYQLSDSELKKINTKKINENNLSVRGISHFYLNTFHYSDLKLKAMFLYLKEKSKCIVDNNKQKEISIHIDLLEYFLK